MTDKIKQNWEKEFEEYHIIFGHQDDVDVIKSFIKSQKEFSVKKTLDRITLEKKEYGGEIDDDTYDYEIAEYKDGYNQAIDDLNNLKGSIKL